MLTVGVGRQRKIALIGTAPTSILAPWDDPSWEIWSHASAAKLCKRVDRFFDLHPPHIFKSEKRWQKDYYGWLKSLQVPIYMQAKYPEIPASRKYPKERILAEYPPYFTNHAAYMMALALTEGVTHLGLFGIHYSSDAEHQLQRPCCEFWMGLLYGRGVQLVTPEGCPLCDEPACLYGYESHSVKQLQARQAATAVKPGTMPPVVVFDPKSSEPRPPLRRDLWQEPAWDRSGLAVTDDEITMREIAAQKKLAAQEKRERDKANGTQKA